MTIAYLIQAIFKEIIHNFRIMDNKIRILKSWYIFLIIIIIIDS